MSDPLRLVWDALAAAGYGPHGQPHDFRSRCPGHDGDNPTSLHVWDRGDGAVSVWCHAHGCSTEEIMARISLRMRDLFPVEVQYRTTRLATARREDFTGNAREVANVLLALQRLGAPWQVSVQLDECPNCECPHPRLVVPATGEAFLHCQRGCSVEAFRGGLAQLLTDQRRAA